MSTLERIRRAVRSRRAELDRRSVDIRTWDFRTLFERKAIRREVVPKKPRVLYRIT